MPYCILSFIGDFPVEAQPYWDREFNSKTRAIEFAKIQHRSLSHSRDDGKNLYTIVIDKDYEFTVLWIKYKNKEISNSDEATNLAENLWEFTTP
jgi:hypothetical protein